MEERSYARFFRVVKVEPEELQFKDDGLIPNSSNPVLIYRTAIGFTQSVPWLASRNIVKEHLAGNCWYLQPRVTMYSYHHYDRAAHKAFAILNGQATLQFGGPEVGRTVVVEEGDVVAIPAGVAHRHLRYANQHLAASFQVLEFRPGSWESKPISGSKNMRKLRGVALKSIAKAAVPPFDPLYGVAGSFPDIWK